MQIVCTRRNLHTQNEWIMKYSKDGITVEPIHDTRRPTKEGAYPVKIRVTYQRTQRYYPTGKSLTVEEWKSIPTTKSRTLVATRNDIENSYNVVRSTVEELANSGDFTLDNLNSRLKIGAGGSLNTMFRAKINALQSKGQIGTMLVYDNVLKGLERFSSQPIKIEDVTPIGRGRYEIQAGEGRKLALTLDQIGKIANYTDGTDTTAKYRDYWLFLYLCNGINVADFVISTR